MQVFTMYIMHILLQQGCSIGMQNVYSAYILLRCYWTAMYAQYRFIYCNAYPSTIGLLCMHNINNVCHSTIGLLCILYIPYRSTKGLLYRYVCTMYIMQILLQQVCCICTFTMYKMHILLQQGCYVCKMHIVHNAYPCTQQGFCVCRRYMYNAYPCTIGVLCMQKVYNVQQGCYV